ncbi:hypothetical protein F4801DRAFT_411911 [Xylaria longipes]|nr:hypothetical protein F4801DRAFT_411911 [Xylaria longipes]
MATDLNYIPFKLQEYERSKAGTWEHFGEDSPLVISCRILLQQLLGWPWYLLTHITAGPESSPRKSRGWWDNSHFMPSSSLFHSLDPGTLLYLTWGFCPWCLVLLPSARSSVPPRLSEFMYYHECG